MRGIKRISENKSVKFYQPVFSLTQVDYLGNFYELSSGGFKALKLR